MNKLMKQTHKKRKKEVEIQEKINEKQGVTKIEKLGWSWQQKESIGGNLSDHNKLHNANMFSHVMYQTIIPAKSIIKLKGIFSIKVGKNTKQKGKLSYISSCLNKPFHAGELAMNRS